MPIYEYKCSECDHRLEVFQKMGDEALLTCPQCEFYALEKIMSRSSFRIGGKGVHSPTTHWGDPG